MCKRENPFELFSGLAYRYFRVCDIIRESSTNSTHMQQNSLRVAHARARTTIVTNEFLEEVWKLSLEIVAYDYAAIIFNCRTSCV